MRRYYLRQRAKGGNWYAIFMDTITKKQDFTRCTGTADKNQADSIAQEWLVTGAPGKSASSNIDRKITFCDYLLKFWDFETSEYFREQETMGKEPHAEHALDMQRIVERYYRPYFQSKLLCQIDEEALQAFLVYLKTQKHLAASTVNSARNASIKALRYAKRKKIIRHFDFDIILRAGGKAAKRGTLEKEEVDKLFSLEWPSIRARIAALIAYYTGMRMGEIRALRICDIHPDKISVKHSWGRISKQKSTKNQEIRNIPILPILYEEIMAYIKEMDLNRIDGLLIPAKNPENPYDYRRIEKEFYRMLEKIGIDEKTRMEKNIVFHSFRHLLAKNLVENGTNKTIAMKILGHKTAHIFDMYADHVDKETFNQMAKAIENVSKNETPKEPIPFLRAV